jgi:hypothetical protein
VSGFGGLFSACFSVIVCSCFALFSCAVRFDVIDHMYISRVEAPLLLCFCDVISLFRFLFAFWVVGWVRFCVCVGWGCVSWILLAAVVQLRGFEAGTVLSLIPLWGGRRRSLAVSSRLNVSPVVGE